MSLFLSCKRSNAPSPENNYFVPIPFTKFSSIQAPCLDMQLEGQTYSLELDLGFQGDITLDRELLDHVPVKTFLRSALIHGIQGKQYRTNLFQLPEITIGATTFTEPIIQTNSPEFTNDSVFTKHGIASTQEVGRIGWQLFQSANILIDVANGGIALCDSVETLKMQGYATENFATTQLLTDRGLLEFEATTSEGVLRCALDTGASVNVLHKETTESIQAAIWEADNAVRISSFMIEDQNFGPITFHQIPIKIPIPIKAILGMEFFRTRVIFIDFSKNLAYFSQLREI
jgi:predicted aspartyl protease